MECDVFGRGVFFLIRCGDDELMFIVYVMYFVFVCDCEMDVGVGVGVGVGGAVKNRDII